MHIPNIQKQEYWLNLVMDQYLNNLVHIKTIKKQKSSRDQDVNTTPSIIMVPMWYMWDSGKSLSNNTNNNSK